MSKEDRNRADARFTKTAGAKPGKSDHDIAAKAVLDFYGPAVEDSAVEAKERKLFHRGTGTVL